MAGKCSLLFVMEEGGARVTKLCKALEKAVEMSKKPLPKSEFLKCFPFAHGNEQQILFLSNVYEEMHRQLLARVENTITIVCREQNITQKLNHIDQVILEDRTLKELQIDELDTTQDTPLAQLQQASMEIKREELRWLQNSLKQEKQKADDLQNELKQKQQLLANILEKLHFQYDSFIERTRSFRDFQIQNPQFSV